jgi:integrase
MAFSVDGASAPTIVNSSVERTREYLTGAEVEKLMESARKSSRYGHRDATMILIAYRHGLRASEVCDLQWHQVELTAGRLHVRRTKRGTPSVHPIQGDELRALRRLQREQPPSPYVFCSERGGPIAPKRNAGHDTRAIQAGWGTKISRTRCAIQSWRRIGSRISGGTRCRNGPCSERAIDVAVLR